MFWRIRGCKRGAPPANALLEALRSLTIATGDVCFQRLNAPIFHRRVIGGADSHLRLESAPTFHRRPLGCSDWSFAPCECAAVTALAAPALLCPRKRTDFPSGKRPISSYSSFASDLSPTPAQCRAADGPQSCQSVSLTSDRLYVQDESADDYCNSDIACETGYRPHPQLRCRKSFCHV